VRAREFRPWASPAALPSTRDGHPSDYGSHIAVVALLLPQNIADFINSSVQNSDSGAVPENVVNLGIQEDRIVVVRNAQNAHC
jgi:hypothetical protein